MRARFTMVAVGLGLMIASLGLPAAEAPQVVKTLPANGDKAVAPSLGELRIEFDRPMNTKGGFSIVGGGETFPKILGRPRWINDRTWVTSIQLKPNHDYWLSVNSTRFQNFRGANGAPAIPYPVKFKTAEGLGMPKGVAMDATINRRSMEQLRRAMDENYSYRDLRGVDWEKQFAEHEAKLSESNSREAFAQACAALLKPAQDSHIWIDYDGGRIGTHARKVTPNMDVKWLARNVPGWRNLGRSVYVGKFPGKVWYLMFASWSRDRAEQVRRAHAVLDQLGPEDRLIIDVRPNGGGDELLAREIAGRFVDRPVVYAKNRNRDASLPGGFTPVHERRLKPSGKGAAFKGKIAVLMGPVNMSSCEAFLLMMRQVPGCKLIGTRSYGSSGNPQPVELANGVTVYLPSWQAMDAEGNLIEGKGIEPDIQVAWKPGGGDPVIEAALRYLAQ